MKKTSLIILVFLFSAKAMFPQIPYNNRYFEKVFEEISVETNVVYGNAPAINFPFLSESNTSPQDLLMDIFQPVGDTLLQRPAIICAHSGAFLSGTKTAEDMVAFCDSLSHRGYVCASIDYRLGMNPLSTSSSVRAAYRAFQDGRAAVRFFKENAILYGIDTNNVYFLGSSAGGYIAQHNMFMDMDAERPPETFYSPDLGCLDCEGNTYAYSGKSDAIVALWGALQDTTLIISSDTLPIFLAHGIADATVPFGYGSAFGNDNFPPTYGSSLVAEQLQDFNNDPETYFVLGAGHEFYGTDNGDWEGDPNQYWDSVFNKVERFSHETHQPVAGFWMAQMDNSAMFYDTSKMATKWYWDFGDGYYSEEQNPAHIYNGSGEFRVIQFSSNELNSWDTASAFAYSFVGVEENTSAKVKMFPNPVIDALHLQNQSKDNWLVQISTTKGETITTLELKKQTEKVVNLFGLPKGVYLIRFQSGSVIFVRRMIKL